MQKQITSSSVGSFWAKSRPFLGLLIAPLIPGLIAGICVFLLAEDAYKGFGMLFLVFSAVFGYPVAFIAGIPLFYLMRRKRLNRLHHYLLVGPILGGVSILLYCAYAGPPYQWPVDWFLKGAVSGAIATTSFWSIARPDVAPP